MKNLNQSLRLPLLAAAFSLAGFCLRFGLYALAVDVKGLLVANHPLEIVLWAVMFLGAALILAAVWKKAGPGSFAGNFPASPAAGLGHILLAGCLLLTALTQPLSGFLGLLGRICGVLAAPALIWGGICRLLGRKPFFGIYGLTCIFLLLHMVSRYQAWSSNPQLQDYVFVLLAAVTMTLFSYYCAAFSVDAGSRRMQLAMGLLTVLLSGPALSCMEAPALYLGSALFAATNLCALTPPVKEQVTDHDPS